MSSHRTWAGNDNIAACHPHLIKTYNIKLLNKATNMWRERKPIFESENFLNFGISTDSEYFSILWMVQSVFGGQAHHNIESGKQCQCHWSVAVKISFEDQTLEKNGLKQWIFNYN